MRDREQPSEVDRRVLEAILVTHNKREFSRIEDLRLEDWVE